MDEVYDCIAACAELGDNLELCWGRLALKRGCNEPDGLALEGDAYADDVAGGENVVERYERVKLGRGGSR